MGTNFLNMFLTRLGRPPGRICRTWMRLVFLSLAIALSVDYFLMMTLNAPPQRVSPSKSNSKDRIFIASMHWTNEAMIRLHWSAALLDLVHHYGANNIYISILESGSLDNSKAALRELDAELEKLGVERSIELLDTSHADEMAKTPGPGWIFTSRGKKELRRIPYLAGIRNRVMAKLKVLADRESGKRTFDKILWLNDVIFTVSILAQTIEAKFTNSLCVD